jgi:hypothetical protein
MRTVRLDDETEKVLTQIVRTTRLSISETLKRGILALRDDLTQNARRIPYDVYKTLDLGPGGYAVAPSTATRRGVKKAITKKLGR